MKKIYTILFLSILSVFAAASENKTRTHIPEWQNEKVPSVGREYPRTSFVNHTEANSTLSDFNNSPFILSLNGKWKFEWMTPVESKPAGFEKTTFDDSGWNEISVPANWEVNGYGTALYTNHPYEFCPSAPTPPALPAHNQLGLYRKKITIPENWNGRRIFLHLAGVKSGCYVYINGQKIGYSEDSKNPAEYDITPYIIRNQENIIALEVYRWSTGSYLECQYFWLIIFIERDLSLLSQPELSFYAFSIRQYLDSPYPHFLFCFDLLHSNTPFSYT